MPSTSARIDEGGAALAGAIFVELGGPAAPPPPPTAKPTLGGPPTVSPTPTPGQGIATDSSGRLPVGVAVQAISVLTADPKSPVIGQMWYRQDTSQFCVRHDAATTKRVTLA